MNLFKGAIKLMNKTKNVENVINLEVVEVVLDQCYLVVNEYEVLYTFTSNKSYAYLLNVELNNVVFLKSYNTEFDDIIITFTDQNGRSLEIEDKVNLTLLINKQKWHIILQNQEQENMSKDINFCNLRVIYLKNMENELLDTATKTGVDAAKSAFI